MSIVILLIIIFIYIIFLFSVSYILDGKYSQFKSKKQRMFDDAAWITGLLLGILFLYLLDSIWGFFAPLIAGPTVIMSWYRYLYRRFQYKKIEKQHARKEKERNIYDKQETLLDKIDYMSGQKFEELLINQLLPNEGYTNISGTPYTGDYGVDIIAYKDGIKCAIQCKRFNEKVSNGAIQEVAAGKKHYFCEKAIVITNNYYTNNAKELAFDNKVELLDRDDLIRMIQNWQSKVKN